jgi:hypothetical protein
MDANSIFVGIDISKMTLDVDIYPTSEPRRFLNDEGSREELCEWLKTRTPTLIVMEATGGLEIPSGGVARSGRLARRSDQSAPSEGFRQSDRRAGEN